MDPDEELGSERLPPSGPPAELAVTETGLFNASVFRDPIALLGFGVVALSSWGRGSIGSSTTPLLTEEPLAGLIDLGIGVSITFAMFGLLPAAVRLASRDVVEVVEGVRR